MNLLKRLAIEGGILLSILGGAKATPIFNPINTWNNYISLSGRLDFFDKDFQSFAKQGDEVGIFRGDKCIGSSSSISPVSHYFDLKIYNGAMKYILNGAYSIKAFNLATSSLWDVKIMGYNPIENNIHFQAIENLGYIPEPSTIALLGAGAIALGLRKRK